MMQVESMRVTLPTTHTNISAIHKHINVDGQFATFAMHVQMDMSFDTWTCLACFVFMLRCGLS